jgi:hypothetical protein
MRKEIDGEYSRQFSGCLQHEPENPEMGSDDPVSHPELCKSISCLINADLFICF